MKSRLLLVALCGLLAPRAAVPAAGQDSVAIGLIVATDDPLGAVGAAVRVGAERAVRRANQEGGFRGRPFRLAIVTQEGLWGRGLGRVVSLSFDQPVVGVIGGLDGRGAHLIEQVVTKARIPFLTPWASDFTLSRGMIPWFFQVIPDDRQQAAAIVADAGSRGERRLVVIADTSYDSRRLTEAVRHEAAAAGLAVDVRPPGASLDAAAGSVVLATTPGPASRALEELRRRAAPPVVYAPLGLAVESFESAALSSPSPVRFPRVPLDANGGDPPPASLPAAFGEDAVRALVAAVRGAGTDDPWRVRDALAALTLRGTTGPLAFEPSGRRSGEVRIR